MDDMDRRTGAARPFVDEAMFPPWMDDLIIYCQEILRVEEALRAVIVAPPEAAPS